MPMCRGMVREGPGNVKPVYAYVYDEHGLHLGRFPSA